MRILGIDASSKTGWCLMLDGKVLESGVKEFKTERGESNGIRFLKFRKWLDSMLDFEPNLIAYERAHHRGGAATELCVGFVTRIQEIAAERDIEYMGIHSATIKKEITGKGNADKDAVKKAVMKKFRIKPIDDNHADAIAIAEVARRMVA